VAQVSGEEGGTAPSEPLDVSIEVTESRNRLRIELPGEWGVYAVEKNRVDIGEGEVGVLQTFVEMVRLT